MRLQRHEEIEVTVGVLHLDGVMTRARGDEDIDGRSRFPGLAAPAREGAGRRPHIVGDGQLGKRLLEVAQDPPVALVPDPAPQLQADRRAPGGVAALDQSADAVHDRRLPAAAQAMDPSRRVHQLHRRLLGLAKLHQLRVRHERI